MFPVIQINKNIVLKRVYYAAEIELQSRQHICCYTFVIKEYPCLPGKGVSHVLHNILRGVVRSVKQCYEGGTVVKNWAKKFYIILEWPLNVATLPQFGF